MNRRVIFYGDLPRRAIERLVAEYGVRVVLDAQELAPWMLDALRDGAYDLVVIERSAPRAQALASVVEREKHVPALLVRGGDGADAVLKSVLDVTHWTPGGKTVYVVVTLTKGGVAKTTTAGALAEVFSTELKRRVLVVDDNPHQANLLHFFTDGGVPAMPVEAIKSAWESLRAYVVPIHENLDLLAPEDYISRGSVTYGAALGFWVAVGALGYDVVVVDTTPAIPTPDAPDEWTDVYLTFGLMTGEFPAVYVTPFTPVEWGHDGLEKTRDLLSRWGQLEWVVPVVVATDALHVVENVPPWLRSDEWRERLLVVPYSRRVRDNPRAAQLRKRLFADPLAHYRPLAARVLVMAERRMSQQGGVRLNACDAQC